LIAVGLFVVFGLGGGFEATYARAQGVGVSLDASSNFGPRWITITILSAAAIICLPRQFQITVVENANENHLRTASWAFPLYLFGISIFTMPIAIMGLSLLPEGADPDMFVLTLPLAYDQQGLALFAFIGGFSSATSMIIIASIALSIMISNHIVVPLALRSPKVFGLEHGQGMTRLLLTSRRVSIGAILFLGFLYFWLTSGSGALAPIGLISFAGVAQFLPAILAALYWRDATVNGALAGLLVGFAFWAYTSFLPSFGTASPVITNLLLYGPWQLEFLRPQALFGLEQLDPLVHSVFWSLLANSMALIFVSFVTRNNAVGQLQAAQFVDVFKQTENSQYSFTRSSAPLNDLLVMTQRVLGTDHANRIFETYSNSDRIKQNKDASPHFIASLEKELAGSIGAASAHVLLGQVVSGDTVTLEEVMQMADETQQILEYSQRLEQTAEELQSTTRQLQTANNQLRQLDQQKDEFLSQVSHEVRTPMTAIRSFSEILLTNQELNGTQKETFINTIHEESMRLTSLLDEILDLNALERNEQLWTNEPINPNLAIARSIQVCTPITEQHQMDVRLGEHIRHVKVEANFDRICQVFINLISNAAKYNDADQPFLEITSEITKAPGKPDQLLIRFTDNGPGISSIHSSIIFDKFWRGARNPDTAQSGSGLGLAISKEILNQMNGSLELELPRIGNTKAGACFAVRLPLHM
ncbi:MAG: ATP-binding protein, partial [Devosiaceae bacterium]|nr:ATP-binding protein [Devosiaceae bacterium]